MLIIFLSLSRLMVVLHPFDTKFKRTSFTVKCLIVLISIPFLISTVATVYLKFIMITLPTSLCLPFVDPLNTSVFIKTVIWVVCITQTLTSIMIIVLHVLLIKALKESRKNIQSPSAKSNSNTAIAVQLFFISLSNILCWFPANIIYITAMFLDRYSTDLIIWTTIGVMPINSIINPMVFFIVCLRKNVLTK